MTRKGRPPRLVLPLGVARCGGPERHPLNLIWVIPAEENGT